MNNGDGDIDNNKNIIKQFVENYTNTVPTVNSYLSLKRNEHNYK